MRKPDLNKRFFTRHLEEDEVLKLVVHKHWLLGLKFLFWPILSFLFSFLLLTVMYAVLWAVYATALWCIVSLVWFLRNFFDYYLDAWLITDQGIIDVEWHGWFHRQSTRVLFSDIQGVSYEIQGVSSTLLRYGDISVEKISTGSAITMCCVPRPMRVEKSILQFMEEYLHSKNLKDASTIQDLLSSVVAREMQMQEFEDEDEEEYDDDEEEYDEDDDE